MSFRYVKLPAEVPGALLLAAMPGRFEHWDTFEALARSRGLSLVVCLTPRSELAELSPAYHAALAQGTVPFRWLHLPMRNFGLPDEPQVFRDSVQHIAQSLRNGDSVLLHCAAGIGRTGSAAACVLKSLGLDTEDSLQRGRDAGSNPQSAQQSGMVAWFS